jgi:anti-sigma regulatory factor (Ser/Thr protein kinase)
MAKDLTRYDLLTPTDVGVTTPANVLRAHDIARERAVSLLFPITHCDEIALAVTELATNLIRHASGGTITVAAVRGKEHDGIEIRAVDNGPGITNVEQAITDGYSTAGGLGLGLGTVNRLMDELEICSRSQGGLEIMCRRWVRAQPHRPVSGGLALGAATRSCHFLPDNGDAFIFKQWEHHALAGVIDGLGHGPFARRASQTARQYIEQHFDQPLDHLFRGTGRACRATRGVVMALARFDLTIRSLTIASVGNIEVRLVGTRDPVNLVVRRGIVGMHAPNPVPTEHAWTPTSCLIMHSDGVGTRWRWSDFSEIAQKPPNMLAHRLLSEFGRIDDDATVLVIRGAD